MKYILCLLLIAITLVTPVHAQGLQGMSRLTLYAGAGLDIASTLHVQPYGYRELNPIIGQHPVQQGIVVTGLTIAVDFLATRYIEPKTPKLAAALRFITGSVHIGAALHNWRLPR